MMQLVYKCRLCGKETKSFIASKGTMASVLYDLTIEDISMDFPAMRRYNVHYCDGNEGGRMGFCDLLGAIEE